MFPRHRPHPLPADVSGPARPCAWPAARSPTGIWSLEARDIRDAVPTVEAQASTTRRPAAAPGMVLRADVLAAAIDAASPEQASRGRAC